MQTDVESVARSLALLGDGRSSDDDGDYCDPVWQRLDRMGLCSLSVWKSGWRVLPTDEGRAHLKGNQNGN
jgi:hypothetical protein